MNLKCHSFKILSKVIYVFFLCLYPWMDIVISFGCVETEERNISILCCFMVDYYREPVYQN